MLHWGPPDIKFSAETQKSPFGDIGHLTKLTHDPLPPYHREMLVQTLPVFIVHLLLGKYVDC